MTHSDKIKSIVERFFPSAIKEWLRSQWRLKLRRDLSRRVEKLKASHLVANTGLRDDAMCLPSGQKVRVTDQTRYAFEHFCFRDPEMVEELLSFVSVAKGKHKLLDVGAEFGFFSLVFALLNSKENSAIAMEPSPIAYPVLLETLARNELSSVQTINAAAGTEKSQLHMLIRGSHVVAYSEDSIEPTDTKVQVAVLTVDSVCATNDFDPELIKVDVEGYEWFVLKGAEKVLEKCKPILFLELHPYMIIDLGYSISELIDWLKSKGYEAFDPVEGRFFQFDTNRTLSSSIRLIFKHTR